MCKDQESIQSSTTPDPGYQWSNKVMSFLCAIEAKLVIYLYYSLFTLQVVSIYLVPCPIYLIKWYNLEQGTSANSAELTYQNSQWSLYAFFMEKLIKL